MRLVRYTVSFQFANAPSVDATFDLQDGSPPVELSFVDDEARAIVAMVRNPDPAKDDTDPAKNLVADPSSPISVDDLIVRAEARLKEAAGAAPSVAGRMKQANEAMARLRQAEAGRDRAIEQAAEADRLRAAIEEQSEARRAELRALDKEIARRRAQGGAP